MKHITHINEFFNFFKKSEFDKIAIGFINRLSKVSVENNPYEIECECDGNTLNNDFENLTTYTIQFDDVLLQVANKFTVSLPSPINEYSIIIDGDVLECDFKYSKRLFNIIDKLKDKISETEKRNNLKKTRKEKLDRLRSNINPAADLLEESTKNLNTGDRLALLQDLSVDLSDDGLYVDVSTDDPRFKRKTGVDYIYLRIDDKDKVFCKNYPKDDMDWLSDKPIINEFLERLDEFGMKRDKDYKVFGGGTGITLVFSGEGIKSIKL